MPVTTSLDLRYSQYDKNGDVELAFNERWATRREDIFAGRALVFYGAIIRRVLRTPDAEIGPKRNGSRNDRIAKHPKVGRKAEPPPAP